MHGRVDAVDEGTWVATAPLTCCWERHARAPDIVEMIYHPLSLQYRRDTSLADTHRGVMIHHLALRIVDFESK